MFGQLIHQLLSLFHQYFNSLLRTQVIFFGRLPPDILIIHRLVNPMTLSTLSRSGSGHCLGTITPSRTGSSRRSRHFLLKHAKSVLSRCQNSCVSGIRSVGSSKKNRGNYAPGAWKCASTHLWLRFCSDIDGAVAPYERRWTSNLLSFGTFGRYGQGHSLGPNYKCI